MLSVLQAGMAWLQIQAVPVEIDKPGLFHLITDFRGMIQDGGAALEADIAAGVKLLDIVIENARRLAIRSPILLEMSTRHRIAPEQEHSTWCGPRISVRKYDPECRLVTLISKSAAYFNSLTTKGECIVEQAAIKPKFLQMLALLLKDTDLQDVATFLESTSRTRADRANVEVLILKVLPLHSINKSIFVREMYMAVRKVLPRNVDERRIRKEFVSHLVNEECSLPGYDRQLSDPNCFWLVKFPEGRSSKTPTPSITFSMMTSNQIPSIDLGMGQSVGEVTCVMTDRNTCLVDVAAHKRITSIVSGSYVPTEATD